MEVTIICHSVVICLDCQIVLVRYPFRYIGFVDSNGLINRRLPAVKIIGKPHGIFRLRSSYALLELFIDDISLAAVDATLSKLIGDRELCLLPFGGVGDVLGNGAGDGGIPAVELPAILTRDIICELRRRHTIQDVLGNLFLEFSVFAGFIGNCVVLLLAIGNTVAVGVAMEHYMDILVAGDAIEGDRVVGIETAIVANGDVPVDRPPLLAERITRLDRAVDVRRELRASLALRIILAVAVGDLDVVIGANGEIAVEVPRCPRHRIVISAAGNGLQAKLGAVVRSAPLNRGIVESNSTVGGMPYYGVRRNKRRHESRLLGGGPNAIFAAGQRIGSGAQFRNVDVADREPAALIRRPIGHVNLAVELHIHVDTGCAGSGLASTTHDHGEGFTFQSIRVSERDRTLLERLQLHFLLVSVGERDNAAVTCLPSVTPIGRRSGDLGSLPHLHRLRSGSRCCNFRSRSKVKGQGHSFLLLDDRSISMSGFRIRRRLLLKSDLKLFSAVLVHLPCGLLGFGLLLFGSGLGLLRLFLGLARRGVDDIEALVLLDGHLRDSLVLGVGVVREHGHVQEREHQQHRQQDRQELALRGVSCVHEPRYGPHTPHLPSTPFPTTFLNTGLETGHLNLLTEGRANLPSLSSEASG